MQAIHLDDELIVTLKKLELPAFYKFLADIAPADAKSKEDLDCLLGCPFNHYADTTWEDFGVHRIETADDSRFIVIKEKERWYVFLKKNQQFNKLRDLFLKHVPFPDAKR